MIFLSVLGYLTWLTAFPLFGPVMASYLGVLKVLAIEKGRVIQVFLLAMLVSSPVIGFLVDRSLRRVVFIWVSTIAASALTFSFMWVNDIFVLFPLSLILGVVAGVAPVAWGAFFADHTSPEDRGRVMAISVAVSMPIAYIFLLLKPAGDALVTLFTVVGSLYLITLLTVILRPSEKSDEIREARRSRGAGAKQTIYYAGPIFLFYSVAGVLLSIVLPTIQDNVSSWLFYLTWAVPFFFGAVIGGVLLDMMGRKFPTMIGLAIIGVSLALLGIVGLRLGFLGVISLAVGFAIVMTFSFIIWADLAPAKGRGLHYGFGFALMAGALMVGLIGVGTKFGSVSASQIRSYMLFSSVAIFLCIPPLIQAEDSLPREVIEKRQMQEYLESARRRYTQKE
jgi:MFS family permease